ncbi:hypothetical protein HYFRA_00006019 [Hymenoscyphus fraxineus]|uniref:Uncharacterized protein n=1 Tax=Hymenoscyphus fraxineus TaxID=746836 RepID=A0A9N9KYM8_9HELO|nr:hypothetical protein HYFRA_00006019 [Hymenoscyphus fraxineus]
MEESYLDLGKRKDSPPSKIIAREVNGTRVSPEISGHTHIFAPSKKILSDLPSPGSSAPTYVQQHGHTFQVQDYTDCNRKIVHTD